MLKIICVIPARLYSTRFPKKILTLLHDKPLIRWVWEKACSISCFNQVVIAIDAEETRKVVQSFGAHYIMTSQECPTGTDRLIEVMQKGFMQADIWVNWQADEPFISEQMIKDLLQSTSDSDIWTLKKELSILLIFYHLILQKLSVIMKEMRFIFLVVLSHIIEIKIHYNCIISILGFMLFLKWP